MLLDIPKIEEIKTINGSARIKYDEFNQRIKIMSYDDDLENIVEEIADYSNKDTIGKLFTVVQKEDIPVFKEEGFIIEAKVDQFLRGQAGYFLSKFLLSDRKISINLPEEEEVLIRSREYISEQYIHTTYLDYTIRDARIEDAEPLARLYDSVFETYPSPMNDPDYIKYAMKQNMIFMVAVNDNRIVSAASADMDPTNQNAEMTDCATHNSHRGQGLMGRLLFELEKELRIRKYSVLYSTARAISTGMNIVFAKHNYVYGGRLVNHCHICGQFENMNIWMKVL